MPIELIRLIESLGIVSVERLIQVIPKTLSVCFQKWIDNRQSQGINFVLLCVLEIVLDSTGFDFDSISILFGCYLDATRTGPMPIRSASFEFKNPIFFTGFSVQVITRNAAANRSGVRPAIEVERPTVLWGFHEAKPGVPSMGCTGTSLDVFERSWHAEGAQVKALAVDLTIESERVL